MTSIRILYPIPLSPPSIRPIPFSKENPLISVMIPVYNCGKFLSETLESVLVQDLGKENMQIEVVDDASTDMDVESLVKKIGKGRINYFRQEENLGSLRNFETCINRSKGRLVHILHGDDRVRKGFYSKIVRLFDQHPQAGAAFSNYFFINEKGAVTAKVPPERDIDGILDNWLIRIAEKQKIQFAAMVVRREVYEHLGSFYGASYGEDWEMWVRIAKNYDVAYTPEILAEYRGHQESLTWKKVNSGEIFSDLRLAIKNIKQHIPKEYQEKVAIRSNKQCAHLLIGLAISVWEESNRFSKAKVFIQQALTFDSSPYVLIRTFKLCLRVLLFKISRDYFNAREINNQVGGEA